MDAAEGWVGRSCQEQIACCSVNAWLNCSTSQAACRADYLDLKLAPRKPVTGLTAYENYRQSQFESAEYQQHIEAGLATVMYTEEEYRAKRQGRVNEARALSRQITRAVAAEEAAKDGP